MNERRPHLAGRDIERPRHISLVLADFLATIRPAEEPEEERELVAAEEMSCK